MKISQRPISKASSLFPKPRHVRNLFGAKRDDPQVRAWLEGHLVKIAACQSTRMREQWGFDVEKGCFVSQNSATPTEVHAEMEPVPAYYQPVITPEERPLAPIFTNFSPSSTRRPLSSPSSPVVRKKASSDSSGTLSGRPGAIVRTCSVQQSLLGSLAVRKSNSVKSLATMSKKLGEEIGAATGRPLVSPREAKARCEESVMM